MTPGDMARVLAKCAAFDQRTVGEADILAWYDAVGGLDFDDAMAAVSRHYATETARMMPAHLRTEVLAIRNERAEKQPHEIRALPSRFETDEIRDERIRAKMPELLARWSVPTTDDPGDVHASALARARQERRGKAPEIRRRRSEAKPVDLAKVTTLPAWATPEGRERIATAELHRAGRKCGRPACPTCNRDEEA